MSEPITFYHCNPWASYEQELAERCERLRTGHDLELDLEMELRLHPFEAAEIEHVETELLPEVQR